MANRRPPVVLVAAVAAGFVLLLGMVAYGLVGAATGPRAEPAPGRAPTSVVAPASTPAPGTAPQAPWNKAPVPGRDATPVALAEWRASNLHATCPLLVFTDLGEAAGATPVRHGTRPGSWAVHWDKPGLPGFDTSGHECPDCGHNIISLAAYDPAAPLDLDAGKRRTTYADGSTSATGPGEPTAAGPRQSWDATVRLSGNSCAYLLTSSLGRDHLDRLIRGLRRVAA
jgi:hypothetical protein